jgi:hypothetical protein
MESAENIRIFNVEPTSCERTRAVFACSWLRQFVLVVAVGIVLCPSTLHALHMAAHIHAYMDIDSGGMGSDLSSRNPGTLNGFPPPPDIKTWSSITFRNFKERQKQNYHCELWWTCLEKRIHVSGTGVAEAATCPLVILAP